MLTRVLELWPCVPEAEALTGSDQAHVLRQAAEAARAVLAATTIAEVIEREAREGGVMYYI